MILVNFDMPQNCLECPIEGCIYHGVNFTRPDLCPIVREVKRGRWKGYNADNPDWQRDDGTPIFLTCSECHSTVVNNGSAHWNFCPNCGADMREEAD